MRPPDRLSSARIVLRPYTEDDLPAFVDFMTDPEASRFMQYTSLQRTDEGARSFLLATIASYASATPDYSLTIAECGSDRCLGACGLELGNDDKMAEVFYLVLPEERGRGIATEALGALAAHVLRDHELTGLVALVLPENTASLAVARKCGFAEVGVEVRRDRLWSKLVLPGPAVE